MASPFSNQSYFSDFEYFLKPTRPSFFDKAGCTRQFESELSLRSLAPLFPIKEGSTSLTKPLFPQVTRDVTAPFNSLYDPFGSPCRGQKRRSEPFHSMVGGPSEVYASSGAAVFCAG